MEIKLETKSFPLIECFIYAPFTSINGNESFSKGGNQFLYLLPFWFPHISINERCFYPDRSHCSSTIRGHTVFLRHPL